MDYESLFSLRGKHVVIIGGSGYLGEILTKLFVGTKSKVTCFGRDEKKLIRISKKIASNNLKTININIQEITKEIYLKNTFNDGKVDVLINLAFTDFLRGFFNDISIDKLDEHASTHFKNYIYPLKFFSKFLNKNSSIIIFNSIWSIVSPNPINHKLLNNLPTVTQSFVKSGLVGLTRQLAVEFAPKGIRVNSISPGYFPKKRGKSNPKYINQLKSEIPLFRIGKPNDLEGISILLASHASSYITGQNLIVDGGYTIK